MIRDGEVNDPAAVVGEEHQDEQQPARRRGHDEEVSRNQLLDMVGQERPPRLRGEWPTADHVFRDGRLRDSDSQFEEFTVNPRRTPERIGSRHRSNEGTDFHSTVGRPVRRRLFQAQ
jgi:hypothetical protein